MKNLNKLAKKIIFFYLLFNLIGYSSFLLNFHPYSLTYNKGSGYLHSRNYTYYITPNIDYNMNGSICFFDNEFASNLYPFHSFYHYCNQLNPNYGPKQSYDFQEN